MQENHKTLSAKEIMEQYDITYQTVNHYTDFGLFPVLSKKGNMRLYDRDTVSQRLKTIRELVDQGYSLRLIRRKLIGI